MRKVFRIISKSILGLALGFVFGLLFSIKVQAAYLPVDSNGICYSSQLTANEYYGIYSDATIIIDADKTIQSIYIANNVTLRIEGDGIHTLTAHDDNSGNYAIFGRENGNSSLVISDGAILILQSDYSSTIKDINNLTVTGGNFTVRNSCNGPAIEDINNLTVTDGNFTVQSDIDMAISDINNLTVTGGNFTAKGVGTGIVCRNLTVSGGTVCGIATPQNGLFPNAGIYASISANISGGVITAKMENPNAYIVDKSSSMLFLSTPTLSNGMAVTQPANVQLESDVLNGYLNCYTVKDSNGSRLMDVVISTPNSSNPSGQGNGSLSQAGSGDDVLLAKLELAAPLGGKQKVSFNVDNTLSYAHMKFLEEHPDITLVYTYSYLDKDYKVVIPGSKAKADPNIPFYGPLYLFGYYGKYKE